MADEGKKPHWSDAMRAENEALKAEVAALKAAAGSVGGAVSVEAPAPAPAVGSPVQPEVFFMHLVVGISAHQGMTAFDPSSQAGLLANGALAYDTYTRLVSDHASVLAKARENMRVREEQNKAIDAEIAAKKAAREAHRARLQGLQGNAKVERMLTRGRTLEEAQAIAAAQARNGIPNPDMDV